MNIRAVREGDSRRAISSIYERSWKHAYQGIVPQTHLDNIPEGYWCNRLDSHNRNTLVMLEDGNIIGTSSYGQSRLDSMNGYGEIISIYLLPEYCGKGYGKQLLQAAVAALADMGYADIFLWVLEENSVARRFYERFGFRCSGVCIQDTIGGRDLQEVQYVYHIIPGSS